MTEYLGVITSIVIIVVLSILLKKGTEKFDLAGAFYDKNQTKNFTYLYY